MHQGLPFPRRFWAIVSVSAGSVLYTLDASVANVALPIIARDLHIAASSSVLLVALYNLVLAMTLLPLAAFGERIGHRRMFSLGLMVYLAAAASSVFASGLAALLTARAFQALGAGAILSVSMAMVRSIYPATHLGRGLGLNTIAATSGAALAPAIGGFIIAFASWRWVFAVGFPLAVLALATSAALPESDGHEQPFDRLGAILCAATFGLLTLGCQSAAIGLPHLVPATVIPIGLAIACIFVRHELKMPRPVLPVDLLALPAIALSMAAAFTAVLASSLLLLFVPFRLHDLGFGPAEIGGMIAPYALATMLFAPASGMLSDKISPSLMGTIGLMVAIIAAMSLGFIPEHPGHFDIAWRIVLCGAGFGIFFSPNARLILASAPRDRVASASSLVSTARMFGQAMGSTLLGLLLVIAPGSSMPAMVAAGLASFACLCSAARMLIPDSGIQTPV